MAGGEDLSEMTGDWPQPGAMAWDVGANIGQNIKLLTSRFGKVLAFEPAHESYAVMAAAWDGTGGLYLFEQAVSAHPGTVVLSERAAPISTGQLVTVGMPYHGDEFGQKMPDWGAETGRREVPCVTLDELTDVWGVPDFVKVDTEGHEIAVLRGGRRLLAERKTAWMVEYHTRERRAGCYSALVRAGYAVEVRPDPDYAANPAMNDMHGYMRAVPDAQI